MARKQDRRVKRRALRELDRSLVGLHGGSHTLKEFEQLEQQIAVAQAAGVDRRALKRRANRLRRQTKRERKRKIPIEGRAERIARTERIEALLGASETMKRALGREPRLARKAVRAMTRDAEVARLNRNPLELEAIRALRGERHVRGDANGRGNGRSEIDTPARRSAEQRSAEHRTRVQLNPARANHAPASSAAPTAVRRKRDGSPSSTDQAPAPQVAHAAPTSGNTRRLSSAASAFQTSGSTSEHPPQHTSGAQRRRSQRRIPSARRSSTSLAQAGTHGFQPQPGGLNSPGRQQRDLFTTARRPRPTASRTTTAPQQAATAAQNTGTNDTVSVL